MQVTKPNVVLLTIDTLRQDVLGCYGYKRPITPNLDRLAARGVRFTQAITGGSWTQAAFPVLLTSSYASSYGGCLGPLASERPSPVEALAAEGYATAGFSSNPHLSKATGYNRGFDHFEDLVPDEENPYFSRIKGGERLLRKPLFNQILGAAGIQLRPARVTSSAADVTDHLCRWIDTAESPFFAWAHYMDVHWPYHLEESLMHHEEIAFAWQDRSIMHRRASFRRTESITPKQRERFIQLYERAVAYTDTQIGRLLDRLDANTVVIVVSDHGEEFLEHGRWGHWESNLHDEILKVPLIMQIPGVQGGTVINRQVRLLDLMPTVLELCGCHPPSNVEGVSMMPLLQQNGGDYDVAECVSEMHRPPRHRIAIRTESFKYIWDNQEPDRAILYNLQDDPNETRNVSPFYSWAVGTLHEHVEAHLQRATETAISGGVPAAAVDENLKQRLRALGYVD